MFFDMGFNKKKHCAFFNNAIKSINVVKTVFFWY